MNENEIIAASSDGLYRKKWEAEIEAASMPDLLSFGTADMDYKAPGPVLSALGEVIARGHLGYPETTDEYYQTTEAYFKRTADWSFDARTSVIQNLGIYLAAWNVLDIMTGPGDQITILTPVHFVFKKVILAAGRRVIECPLKNEGGNYTIDFSRLEACFASGSRMLWFCNPSNPVGRAWSKEELSALAALCIRYHVFVLSDDVYFGLVLPGARYTPLAALSKEISYQTVTLYSVSKSYNLAGLRHSFTVIENPEIMKRMREEQDKMGLVYGQSIMGMAAQNAALSACDAWLAALMEKIRYFRSLMEETLRRYGKEARLTPADATYFAWIDLRGLKLPPKQLKEILLREAHILVENGADFGKGGDGFIRWNLACSEENLKEGLERFAAFLKKHRTE